MKRALIVGAIGGLINAKIAGPLVGVGTFALALLLGRLRDLQLEARASREKKRQEGERERNAREAAQLLRTYLERHPPEERRVGGSSDTDHLRSLSELRQQLFVAQQLSRRQPRRSEPYLEHLTSSAALERSPRAISGYLARPRAREGPRPEQHKHGAST